MFKRNRCAIKQIGNYAGIRLRRCQMALPRISRQDSRANFEYRRKIIGKLRINLTKRGNEHADQNWGK